MKSISTKQFGRVFLLIRTDDTLVLDKKGWAKTTYIHCLILSAATMQPISAGFSVRSPREKDTGDLLVGIGKGARLAFVRAMRKFKLREDRQKLGKAWEAAQKGEK